jgi:hypothetical protein
MIRFLLVFCLSLLTLPVFAQLEIPTRDGVVYYEGVVEVPNQSQDELYQKGRAWLAETYYNVKDALLLADQANGKLMSKASYYYDFGNGLDYSQVNLNFVLALDLKEGRYRYRLYNFTGINTKSGLTAGPADTPSIYAMDFNQCYVELKANKRPKYNTKVLLGLDQQVKVVVAALEKALRTPVAKDDF